MAEKCIDSFINKLRDCNFSFTQPVENIYSRNVEGNENTFNNLRLYLNKMKDIKPKYLLIGEAPGYNGCRWSGIPFVSERILRDNNFFGLENGYKVRNDNKPQSEASATIVWNCLNEIGIFPLIWNAFPFHPYQKDKTKSNRTPNKEELVFGKEVLKAILQLFNIEPTNVIAIGKKAKESLETFTEFETIKCIRHPANGGKADFVKGLKTYLV